MIEKRIRPGTRFQIGDMPYKVYTKVTSGDWACLPLKASRADYITFSEQRIKEAIQQK